MNAERVPVSYGARIWLGYSDAPVADSYAVPYYADLKHLNA